MKKRLSVPLLLGAALLVWALLSPPAQLLVQEPKPPASSAELPESYARDVVVREFGQGGELLSETKAAALRRYADGSVTELDILERRGYDGDFAWVANADQGTLLQNNDMLELRNNVHLRYATQNAEFVTQAMVINLAKQTARSLAPVRSWQGDHVTSADNLYSDLNRRIATLNGSVRSTYIPVDVPARARAPGTTPVAPPKASAADPNTPLRPAPDLSPRRAPSA